MSDAYVGEIRMFGGDYAPIDWKVCNGDLLLVNDYPELFALIQASYGGDGQTTFALPDLRGRLPLAQGNGFTLTQQGGVEQVSLAAAELPAHAHGLLASARPANSASPGDRAPGETATAMPYVQDPTDVDMSPQTTTTAGGGQPHTNVQPYQCVNFIIAVEGIFPSPQT